MNRFLHGQLLTQESLGHSFSVLFFFLVCINGLADGLSSNAKLFADDTSSFSVIQNVDTCANELNNDLYKSKNRAFQWKTSFNPDPSKQTQKFIFNRKTKKILHLRYVLTTVLSQTLYQKRLGIFLHARLTFEGHLKIITTKINKTKGLLQK